MYEVKLTELPESLDDNYIIIVSNNELDLRKLDEFLNKNEIITGLVDEFTYLSKSNELTSILLKIDSDSEIHKDKVNLTINGIYVCDIDNYHNIIKNYKSLKSETLDISSKTYGYNDIKLLFKQLENDIRVLILMPFSGRTNVINDVFSSLSNMFRVAYGVDIKREDIDNELGMIILRFKIPIDAFKMYGRRNFDLFIIHILSILNIDKYTMLESMSNSKEVLSLLDIEDE